MEKKMSLFKNPGKIPDKIEIGRDKLNDPIELCLKLPALPATDQTDKGGDEEVKNTNLSFDELSYHLKIKCSKVLI